MNLQTARYPITDIPDIESLTATIVKIEVEWEGTGANKRIHRKRFYMLKLGAIPLEIIEIFCIEYAYDADGDLISQTRNCSGS